MAINVDSGDTNYKMHKEGYAGKVTVSSAIYVTTGGARAPHNTSDVPLSWEVAASANAKIYHPCFTPWIEIFNSTTGSRTVTVEAARDGSATALKDTEMWLEVEYLGTTGETRGSYSSGRATVIAAGANLTTGSTTWTGLNATNTRYSLARTVTAEEQGVIRARVGVAADTTTNKVYVDPRITLS